MERRRHRFIGFVAAAVLLGSSFGAGGPAAGAPGDPGAPIKLNGDLTAGGSVGEAAVRISPNGQFVVYAADQRTDEVLELFSVPLEGGSATRLNKNLPAGQDVVSFQISPDSTRVVYITGDLGAVELRLELYSVPIGGGEVEKLNGPLAPGGSVIALVAPLFDAVLITPDSSRVVYGAEQDTDDVTELYSVPIDGSLPPIPISGALDTNREVFFPVPAFDYLGLIRLGGMALADNGQRVLYLADAAIDDARELWSVPVDGNAPPTRVNAPLAAGQGIEVSGGWWVSAFGDYVVYRTDQDIAGVDEIYQAPADASAAAVKVNTPLVAGRSVESFAILPNDRDILYIADQDTDDVDELYAATRFADAIVKLNPNLPANRGVEFFAASANGAQIVYFADQETNDVLDLYSVPVRGGISVKLTPPANPGEMPTIIPVFTSDASTVVLGMTRNSGVVDLLAVPATGGPFTPLDQLTTFDSLFSGGAGLALTTFGGVDRAVYLGGRDGGPRELWSTEIAGGSTPARLNRPLVTGGGVDYYVLTPDRSRVVYLADQDTVGVHELYLVEVGHSCKGRLATITGTPDDDEITGTPGDDVIVTLGGDDTVDGGGGDDLICTGSGEDTVNGGAGGDTIVSGGGQDTIAGGSGNDRITTGKANDIANGGADNDRIKGNGGRDALRGDRGNDDVSGGGGDDALSGAAGNDDLNGGKGDDDLNGGPGNDDLVGGRRADTCDGGPGIDTATTCETTTSIRRAT